ncbi:hypothetical protein [Pseudonocardia sp.]|uniref:hypothetical protein n=1 Tax=Pseudonocardia sp. TaxID=60912 RepID=UPI003D1180E7
MLMLIAIVVIVAVNRGDESDPPSASPAPTNPPASEIAPVMTSVNPADFRERRYTISLMSGSSVDLDSTMADSSATTDRDADFKADGPYLLSMNSGLRFSHAESTPDVAYCAEPPNYLDAIDLSSIDPKPYYCVRTTEGRYAWIRILESGDPGVPVVIEVLVWDKQR